MDEKNKNKLKRQSVQDECFEKFMDNNETKIVNYNLQITYTIKLPFVIDIII